MSILELYVCKQQKLTRTNLSGKKDLLESR